MRRTLLNTAELGTTGLHITRVGFDTWATGGGWQAPRDLEGNLEGDLEETL